jgi:hypothetical protein
MDTTLATEANLALALALYLLALIGLAVKGCKPAHLAFTAWLSLAYAAQATVIYIATVFSR